jgi:hypothetical protein
VFLTRRAGHDYFGAELGHWKLIHGRENLLLNLLRDVMLDGHVYMTLVPQLPYLFLEREQDPVKCLLKWNNRNGAVQTLFKDHAIERIQCGHEFPQEPGECIVDE